MTLLWMTRIIATSRIWMRHVTHMNEPCHPYEWVMSHTWVRAHIWIDRVTHICHTWMSHVSFMCGKYEWQDSLPHNYLRGRNDSSISVTWLIDVCDMTHAYLRLVWCDWVTSHIWMRHVTHMNGSCHTYEWVRAHICTNRATRMNVSCHTYEWVMSHIWMSHDAQ